MADNYLSGNREIPSRFGFLAKLNDGHTNLLSMMKEAEDLLTWIKERKLTIGVLRGAMQVQNGGTVYDFDRMQSFSQLFEMDALGPLFQQNEETAHVDEEENFNRFIGVVV